MRRPEPFETRLRAFETSIAEALSDRMHRSGRLTKPTVIAARLGLQSEREVNRQASGEAHAQLRVWFALLEDDPEGAQMVVALLASELGMELRPAAAALAQAPSLQQALSAVTGAAQCSSESMALAYGKLHDGRLEDGELSELEWQWRAEDRARQAMRDALRAMAEPTEAGQPHVRKVKG